MRAGGTRQNNLPKWAELAVHAWYYLQNGQCICFIFYEIMFPDTFKMIIHCPILLYFSYRLVSARGWCGGQTILILSFSLFFQNKNNFDQSQFFLVLKNWSTEKKTFSVSSEVSNDWIPFSFCVYYLHHDVSWQNFFFQWVTK